MAEAKASVTTSMFPDRPRASGLARPIGPILAVAAVFLVLMPFYSTFAEVLTSVAMLAGIDAFLGQWAAPLESRLVHGVLAIVGLQSSVHGSILSVGDGRRGVDLYIAWNCVGWQTLLFLLVSMIGGLVGSYTWLSRAEVIALGVGGIFVLNVARITIVALVAFAFGQVPAIIVHDYGSILMTVGFLMAFWAFAYGAILEPTIEATE